MGTSIDELKHQHRREQDDQVMTQIVTEQVAGSIANVLGGLGQDLERDGLAETPMRVAKALLELTAGYRVSDPAALLKTFDNDGGYDEMVIVKDIPFYSLCEHHMLPFFGVAHVAYLPTQKIVGLSKFARLVDAYARRLQVQERLTAQVATTIDDTLSPLGVGVVVQARHFCMELRGVQKPGASTITTALRGAFKDDPATRAEFLSMVNG